MAPSVREDDEGKKFTYGVPSYVQDQIHSSKKYGVSDKFSGHRSAQYDHLLQELTIENKLDPRSVKQRINDNQYRQTGQESAFTQQKVDETRVMRIEETYQATI